MQHGFGSRYRYYVLNAIGIIIGSLLGSLIVISYIALVEKTEGIKECTDRDGVAVKSAHKALICIDKKVVISVDKTTSSANAASN